MAENDEERKDHTRKLFPNDPKEYGSDYNSHLLEQYKMYLQSADNISERRNKSNAFFLTANSFLLAALGIAEKVSSQQFIQPLWLLIAAAGGILFAITWLLTIHSYRQMNTIKFRLIREIERKLPAAPYDQEWVEVGEGKKWLKYLPISKIDRIVPCIFMVLYISLLVVSM